MFLGSLAREVKGSGECIPTITPFYTTLQTKVFAIDPVTTENTDDLS